MIIVSDLQLKVQNIIHNKLTIFMLHIYMLRSSSFMQVKRNRYRMGTIPLTVKTNSCKSTLLEAASDYLSSHTISE